MISLDFYTAIAVFSLIFLSVFLALWLFARKQKDRKLSLEERFIWHCSVCTHTYVNTRQDVFSECPRCGSYNKK